MIAVGSLLRFALGIRWAYALLMASAWSGMNTAIVNAVCKYLKVKEETYVTLTMISLVDDPIVLITTLTILNYILLGGIGSRDILFILTANICTSISLGAILGLVWLNVLYFFRKGEYTYTFTLAAILFVYSLTEILGGTGVIAIFLFGLVIGNYGSIVKALKLKISVNELAQLKSLTEKIPFRSNVYDSLFLLHLHWSNLCFYWRFRTLLGISMQCCASLN